MGFYSFVLLTAIVLLACVNYSSRAATATFPAQGTTERTNRHFVTRFPRTSEPTDEDDEARMLSWFGVAESVYRTAIARYRVWTWMVKEKMADEAIIEKLNIGDDVLSYLKSPEGVLLWEVAKAFSERSKMSPSSQNPLLKTLLAKHKGDQAALARSLYTASRSKTESTKNAATNLLGLQYQVWLKDGETIDRIFDLMRKDQSNFDFFADQNLKVLEGFIKLSGHVEDPLPKLVDTLVKSFGGQLKFLDTLINLKIISRQKLSTVEGLEGALLADWKKRKLHPAQVVAKELGMKLDDLASPAVETVMKFITDYNRENKQRPFSLVQMFMKLYGSASVTKILIKAKERKVPVAKQLMLEQIDRWLIHRKPVMHVFEELDIKGDGYKHLKRVKFWMLITYSEAVQEKTKNTILPDIYLLLKNAFENEEKRFMVIAKAMTRWETSGDSGTTKVLHESTRTESLDNALYDGFEEWFPHVKPEDVKAKFSQVDESDEAYVKFIVDEYKSWIMREKVTFSVDPRRV